MNVQDRYGNTPLHVAVTRGDPVMVKLLLLHGAYQSINTENHERNTPLRVAVYNNAVDIVREMLLIPTVPLSSEIIDYGRKSRNPRIFDLRFSLQQYMKYRYAMSQFRAGGGAAAQQQQQQVRLRNEVASGLRQLPKALTRELLGSLVGGDEYVSQDEFYKKRLRQQFKSIPSGSMTRDQRRTLIKEFLARQDIKPIIHRIRDMKQKDLIDYLQRGRQQGQDGGGGGV